MLPARQAVPLPDGASFELGASLGVPAMTAHVCLFSDGPVNGQTVLVAGVPGRSVTTRSNSPNGLARASSPP